MSALPAISIIIPSYNAAATLAETLQSVVNQHYPSLELIVLDAGSQDGTLQVIERFAPHIAHWRSHKDGGPHAAFNEGIAKASGEVIALLGADDWYEPRILHEIGQAFVRRPDADMVTCAARMVVKDGQGGITEKKRFEGKQCALSALASPIPYSRFYRRHIFERHGNFMETNHRGEWSIVGDLDLLLRLSKAGLTNIVLPSMGYNYRVHEGSITFSNNAANNRRIYDERADIAERHLALPGFTAQERARLKRWHRRATARLCYYHLKQRQWVKAREEARRGIKVNDGVWMADMLRLLVVSLFKKLDI